MVPIAVANTVATPATMRELAKAEQTSCALHTSTQFRKVKPRQIILVRLESLKEKMMVCTMGVRRNTITNPT
jgi:hypothetical protein